MGVKNHSNGRTLYFDNVLLTYNNLYDSIEEWGAVPDGKSMTCTLCFDET